MRWRIETFDSVDSTQDILKIKANDGAPEGTVIHGLEQLKGRGRHGNTWMSPKGNLYMSVLLRPDCDVAIGGQLAFVIAVAVGEAVGSFLPESKQNEVTLKWPNDILYNGLKLSGILLETNTNHNILDAVYVGMGVNVDAPPEEHIGVNSIAANPVNMEDMRSAVLERLAHWYSQWQQKGFAPIRLAWLKQAHGLDQPMRARMPNHTEEGVFGGINEDGALILKKADQDIMIQAAEVHFGV